MARQFTRRARSRKRWIQATDAIRFSALSAGTSAQVAIGSQTTEETLLRVRGSLMAYVDAAQAPGGQALIGVGLIVMPEGTATTVTSSPISDGNAPWLWLSTFTLGYEEMVTDVIDIPGLTSYRETIDSKAMRILRPDREIQIVAENVTGLTALSVNIAVMNRYLMQVSG